jgi:hypothetical protein
MVRVNRYPVARLHERNIRPHGEHLACNLVAKDEGFPQPEIPGAAFREIMQIRAAYPAGPEADKHFAMSGKRLREVFEYEIARRAKDAGVHGVRAPSMGLSQ